MSGPAGEEGRRVLRRCRSCRLLFEALEGAAECVVCGAPVGGLALPLGAEPVPAEVADREPTAPVTLRPRS
jgi:hypothetical protein